MRHNPSIERTATRKQVSAAKRFGGEGPTELASCGRMTWKPIVVSEEEETVFVRAFSKKARFLLDEDVDPSLAPVLRKLGWNHCG